MRKEKSKKIGVILITVFIALSMILSIFAIVLDNQGNNLKYNDYKFSLTDSGYKVKINDKFYVFQYFPTELENYNLTQDIKDMLTNSQALAVFFDPNSTQDDLTYIDYARFNLDDSINKPLYFGIISESETYLLPILSCENATAIIPFIFLNISSEASISKQDNCIVLNARFRDMIALQERISYHMLGVMK